MFPTEEPEPTVVDLTSSTGTPPKKMKQARLPFATVNKQGGTPENGRKRKLSDHEVTPNKNPKKDVEVASKDEVIGSATKAKLASFAAGQENRPIEESEVATTSESPKDIKKKTAKDVKAKKSTDVEGRSDKFYGLLKMPFKKGDKKNKIIDIEDDNTIDLDMEIIGNQEQQNPECGKSDESGAEETSMTDEWAKFHESGGDETNKMDEESKPIKRTPRSSKKTKEEKEKDKLEREKLKEEKEKKKVDEKKKKEEVKLKKVTEKQELQTKKKADKEKTKDDIPTPKLEPTVAPIKVNPLAKFLVKSKLSEAGSPKESKQNSPQESKKSSPKESKKISPKESKTNSPEETLESSTATNDEDEEISVIEEKKTCPTVKPAEKVITTSTPLRQSPRKSMSSTPNYSPFDPMRVRQVAIAKLKVKVSELNIVMDKAVQEKDFLAAHEVKQEIAKLEEEIEEKEKESTDTGYVSQSLVNTLPIEEKDKSTIEVIDISNTEDNSITKEKEKSTLLTPVLKRNISIVSTPGAGSPLSARKLTPKQKAIQEKSRQKREALEKEKQDKKDTLVKEKEEREKKKSDEKADKDRSKEIERRAREVEKMEKDRIKKQKDEEREEERLKKKAEKDVEQKQKDEEKKLKDEERKQKEEERIKQEEEKKQLEEVEKDKAKKKAEAFKSFFKKDDLKEKMPVNQDVIGAVDESNFTQFRLKVDMRLAPLVRGSPGKAKASIDSLDMPSGPSGLYLSLLKTDYTPGSQTRTWPYKRKEEDEVKIIEDEEEDDEEEGSGAFILAGKGVQIAKIPRAKLLQFKENQRPAYWGSWTKKSKFISGRRPFGRDEDRFDYDYESDEDWEEEEEGESISDAENDKEEDKEEDVYEVDNEFFVPHGYLSDEEEVKDDDEVFNPETAKEKIKLMGEEFEAEQIQKKKAGQLKPRLWGVHFEGQELDTGAATCQLVKILGGYSAVVMGDNNNTDTCIMTSFSQTASSPSPKIDDDISDSAKVKGSSTRRGPVNRAVPPEAIPDLVRLMHGNVNNKMFLAREFIAFWSKKVGDNKGSKEDETGTPGGQSVAISKRKMVEKITEIAEYKRIIEGGPRCWVVRDEILSSITSPPSTNNSWEYILDIPANSNLSAPVSRPGSPCANIPAASLITKFTKVLSAEEREELREKEAAEVKERLEAKKIIAEQEKAKKAEQEEAKKAEQVLTLAPVPVASTDITKYTKVLPPGHKMSPITVVASQASPITVKRRLAGKDKASPITIKKKPTSAVSTSSPIANCFKTASPTTTKNKPTNKVIPANPIALAMKKTPGSKTASPIATKNKPSNKVISASPIAVAIKRTPVSKTASPIAVKRRKAIPSKLSVEASTIIRSSPRKKLESDECITID